MMRRHATSAREDDRGFSLVELLITAALIPIVLGAAYFAFGAMTGNYSKIEAVSEATGEAQRGLDTLVRELRQAQEIKDGGGAFQSATATSCSFYCDVDRDGTPERVTYYVDGTDLYRTVGEAGIQVYPYNFVDAPALRVLNIGAMTSAVVFTYYDSNAPLDVASGANLNTICAVGIHLSATRPSQGGLVSVDFSTKVKIRALFNSLS
jgi:prepilin-type N-terminal cleavage/methylation domain-containing protein